MTALGLTGVLLDTLLWILALGTGVREWLIAALGVGAFLLFALVSLALALVTVRFEGAAEPERVIRAEGIRYSLRVRGRAPLPVTARLTVLPPGVPSQSGDGRLCHAFLLTPFQREPERIFDFSLPCPHRGEWQTGPETLYLRDIFGLFSLPVGGIGRQVAARTVLVLPQIHPLPTQLDDVATANGNALTHNRSAISGELLGDTRMWQPGDTTRRIHWKQTARTHELYIRQYEDQENPHVLVVLDLNTRSAETQDTADIAAEIAVSLAQNALQRRRRVCVMPVRGNGTAHPLTLREERELPQLTEWLARWEFVPENTALAMWQMEDFTHLIAGEIRVITDHPSAELLEMLQTLNGRGYRVSCFLPAPLSVPEAADAAGLRPVAVTSPDEISGKVGMAL